MPPSNRTSAAALRAAVIEPCGERIESVTQEAGRKG
jgi:hypothetical protein